MCQLPALRRLGVSLLTAAALTGPRLTAAADAGTEQDAGVPDPVGASDAGAEGDGGARAEPDGGTAFEPTLLFPSLGATDVVINPGLLLRIERATLDPALSKANQEPTFIEGLLLRDAAGTLVAAGPLVVLQPPRISGAEPRVELSSAPLELKANTRYEVLSRIEICETGGERFVCLTDEYRTLGRFETGIVFDHEPPSISSVHEDVGPAPCVTALSVVASDDLAPLSALRFVVDEQAWLGPSLLLPSGPGPAFATQHVQLVPVDPSGNRGTAVSVDSSFCGNPYRGGDLDDTVRSYDPPATPAPVPPSQQPRHREHGCSLAAQPAAAPSSFSVLALAGVWLYGRRRVFRSRAA